MATQAKRSSFSTLDFLIILFKYSRVVAGIVLLSTAITAVLMLRAPDIYEAQVGIVLNTTSNIRLTDKDRAQSTVSLRETMNSEVEWLLSSSVLEHTYQLTYPDKFATLSPQQRQRAVQEMKGKISGLPKRNTSIIEVKYRSQDPEEACLFLNNLVQAQLDLKTERDPEAATLLQGKLQATRAELDSVNQVLNAVQLGSRVYSSDRQIAMLVETNNTLQIRQRDLLQEILERELVAGRYADFLARKPDISHIALPEGNPVLASIQTRYVEQLDHLRALRPSYSDSSPELEAAEQAATAMGDEFYEVMASAAEAGGKHLQLLKRESQGLREKIAENEAELTRFPEADARLAALFQYRDSVNDLLRILYRQQSESELAVIGDRANQTLELISPAVVPEKPIAPRRVLQTLVVFFMSLLASIALAYVLELSSGVFETAKAVEETLNAPVVCIIRQKQN